MIFFEKVIGNSQKPGRIVQLILQPQAVIEAASIIAETVLECADEAAAGKFMSVTVVVGGFFQDRSQKIGNGFPVLIEKCFITHVGKAFENQNLTDGQLDYDILIGDTAALLYQSIGKIMLSVHGAGNQYGDPLHVGAVSQLRA